MMRPDPERVENGQVWLTGALGDEFRERTNLVLVVGEPSIGDTDAVVEILESWDHEKVGNEASANLLTFRARVYHRENREP